MKKNLKEGDDYMLIDENIYELWTLKYDKKNEIKRFGIEDENGETIVELHLKVFNLYLIPNAKLFKMKKMFKNLQKGAAQNHKCPTIPIYISRSCTMQELENDIKRKLTTYVYFKLQERSMMFGKCRLWKSDYDED
jgi:hypothetical protein